MDADCTVLVLAHNEGTTIGRVLEALMTQALQRVGITRIRVVSSASTDGTDAIVAESALRDPRIELITQPQRLGKAIAINAGLQGVPQGGPVAMISGDCVPDARMVEELAAPLIDVECGMTGCRPMPLDDRGTFCGFFAHLLWGLHHELALRNPKAGEAVAFRKTFEAIDERTAVDEAMIEHLVRAAGGRVAYVPAAVVYNQGPTQIRELFGQRRRIHAGHTWLAQECGHRVASFSGLGVLGLLLGLLGRRLREAAWFFCAVGLEAAARAMAVVDVRVRRRRYTVWQVARTARRSIGQNGASVEGNR